MSTLKLCLNNFSTKYKSSLDLKFVFTRALLHGIEIKTEVIRLIMKKRKALCPLAAKLTAIITRDGKKAHLQMNIGQQN